MRKITRAIIVIIFITSFVNTALSQRQEALYNIKIGRDGFASFDGNNYTTIEVYLNNNSNDTLYYRGADCNNLLFSVNSNSYFHLTYDPCKQRAYVRTALPPHRSQKLGLYLTMDKSPDKDVPIIIHMKLYRWAGKEAKQNKDLLMGDLSDSIVLRYNSNHQSFSTKKDFEILEKKQKSILPDKGLYLLTDNDRRQYVLTVDNIKISRPRDTSLTYLKHGQSKIEKVVTVPVYLNNNSNNILRFYSMSCSWYEFWDTNYPGVGLSAWGCNKNIPEIITVAPHKVYRRDLIIIYDSTVKKGERYRISMSLIKAPDNEKWGWGFEADEYIRFNKIWSNDITIQ